jgi:GxxExxY protein
MVTEDKLTSAIIGAAIEVHKALGPGLLESAYEKSLAHELSLSGLIVKRQVQLPIEYKGLYIDQGYRLDIVVNNEVIVELKHVESIMDVHTAQVLTYLRLSEYRRALLINFNVRFLKDGLKRFIL